MVKGSAERIKIEKKFKDTEKQLETLISNLPGMAYRCLNDPDRTMLFVSQGALELTGYQPEELVSRGGLYAGLIHPADREKVWDQVQDAIGRKRPFQLEYRITTSRREEKWVWDQGRVDVSSLQDKPLVLDGLIIDITDQKKMEMALTESNERLSIALDGTDEGIWDWDVMTGRLEYDKNWVRLLGYKPGELDFGLNWWKKNVHPDGISDFEKALKDYLEGRARYLEFEYRIKNNSGEWRWVRCRGKCTAYDRQGRPLRFIGTQQDITERKQLEAQFYQAQKMEAIGRLTGGVSHDFNNLLTSILGYGELLTEDLPVTAPSRRFLDEIIKAGKSAAALIRQLLAFSREQLLELQPMDLNKEITDLKGMLQRLIGEDVLLETYLTSDRSTIKADRVQMQQVIINLAVNARDAMPGGGKLTIETADVELDEAYAGKHDIHLAPGRYVMLSVSDTGSGMDRETRERIFEPFFTTKGEGEGTGLGLSTVYGIVKQCGGYIWVYSEINKGTTFKIYMPAAEESAVLKQGKQVSPKRGQGSETVLIVEDEQYVRELIVTALAQYGYRVLEARDGEDALNLCARHKERIHLMVTDVVMPGMSGRDLAARLKAERPDMKVLFMSGYSDNAIVRHAILDSDVFFVQKPISPTVLVHRIQKMLNPPQRVSTA